jgi:5'-nucleotidase / UDP-sugar diphosphatase
MKRILGIAAAALVICAAPLVAAEKTITILHTNDMHSHFMGFSPELDYTADKTGDDATIGGFARLATAIAHERKARTNPVLLIDAGDFTMGSLFHMLAREEAFELRIMKAMGYDLVTLGNHEFDLMPKGLARILTSGAAKGMPEVVFSSAVFSAESDKDDTLEAAFKKIVKPYTVKTIDGIKVGFFSVIGDIAIGDAPFASPVKFRNKFEASKEMVKLLREQEKVDMVVCISHSGVYLGSESEDEALAKKIPGIDVIISGHTHTRLDKPLVVNGVIIVQAYEYAKCLGVLDVAWENGKARVKNYRLVDINDSIAADMNIQRQVDGYIGLIDQAVLAQYNLAYWKVIAKTDFDLKTVEDETTIGNLITDSIRWYVNKYDSDPADPVTKVAVAVESNGVIRDHLLKGKTGKVCVADVFRTIPLGIGMDDTMAYPLVTIYVYASELKKALEVLTSIYPMKGDAYFLQFSGLKFTYNPHRMIFDRVTGIWLGSEEEGFKELDYSSGNTQLYRIAANIYDTTFLKVVGDYTFHFLDIIPKDRKGQPIASLLDFRVDADKTRPGIQELKEWVGVIEFIRGFADTDRDGLPNIPEKYRDKQGRILKQPSWNPVSLLSHGTKLTWIAFAIFIVIVACAALIARVLVKKFRKPEIS